jgi:hypothetical protein
VKFVAQSHIAPVPNQSSNSLSSLGVAFCGQVGPVQHLLFSVVVFRASCRSLLGSGKSDALSRGQQLSRDSNSVLLAADETMSGNGDLTA